MCPHWLVWLARFGSHLCLPFLLTLVALDKVLDQILLEKQTFTYLHSEEIRLHIKFKFSMEGDQGKLIQTTLIEIKDEEEHQMNVIEKHWIWRVSVSLKLRIQTSHLYFLVVENAVKSKKKILDCPSVRGQKCKCSCSLTGVSPKVFWATPIWLHLFFFHEADLSPTND